MIPDEAIEAAALSSLEWDYGVADWAMVDERTKANYLDKARAALEAAAPHLMAGLRAELARLAQEFDAAEGGTLAYTFTDGRHAMRKNAHDQLMYIIGDHLGTPDA